MTDDDETGWELVMPFVVCASQGGPYDDEAFVAGFELGRIDRELAIYAALNHASLSFQIRTELVPQLELLAMRERYTLRTGYEHDGRVDVDLQVEEDT